MRTLFVALILLGTASTYAADAAQLEREVVENLVANATKIKLVDHEGEYVPADQQLPALIADSLLRNYVRLNKEGILAFVTATCKNTTPSDLLGASLYSCRVVFGNGDFVEKNGTLKGPDGESGVVFNVDVVRGVRPGAKAEITSKKAVREFAG